MEVALEPADALPQDDRFYAVLEHADPKALLVAPEPRTDDVSYFARRSVRSLRRRSGRRARARDDRHGRTDRLLVAGRRRHGCALRHPGEAHQGIRRGRRFGARDVGHAHFDRARAAARGLAHQRAGAARRCSGRDRYDASGAARGRRLAFCALLPTSRCPGRRGRQSADRVRGRLAVAHRAHDRRRTHAGAHGAG